MAGDLDRLGTKRVGAALKESEERYRSLFDRSYDCLYVHDFDGFFLDANPAALNLLGYKKEDLAGLDFASLLSEDQMPRAMDAVEILLKTGRLKDSLEFHLRGKDGRQVMVEVRVSLLYREGVPYAIMGIARDITERVEVQNRLKRERDFIHSLLDSIPLGISLVSRDGRFEYVNPQFEALFGYKLEEIPTGMEWLRHVLSDPELYSQAVSVWNNEPEERGRVEAEAEARSFPFVCRDGLKKEISFRSVTLEDGHRLILYEDITVRMRAKEALQASEERYRHLVKYAPAGIYEVDLNTFRFISVNDVLCEYSGYTREELMEMNPWEFLAPESRAQSLERVGKLLAGEAISEDTEYYFQTKSGSKIWGLFNITVIKEGGRPVRASVIVHDITERKKAEEKLRAALREKELLLNEIHHRIKNSLQVVSSLLSLQARQEKDEKILGILQESRNRLKTMALIHETLYRSTSLAKIDMKKYITSLARDLFAAYCVESGRICLKVSVDEIDLGLDWAGPCGLVLNELISNSIKYAFPEGVSGEIGIAARLVDGNEIELVVSDSGVGIPEDIVLSQVETLGLSLVRGLVESQLHGTLNLNREQGTEFTIRFKQEGYQARV